jgi:hypothetical protein
MTASNLPPLYALDKNGRERVWTVFYTEDSTYKEYGLTLGKITKTSERKFTSKNVGKKNETSTAEQAKKEAMSDWITKVSDGFKPSPNDEEGVILYTEIIRNLKANGNKKSGITAAAVEGAVDGVINCSSCCDSGITATDLEDKDVKNKLAMTCNVWSTDKKCLKYFDFEKGVYVQPKYDGVRCTAFLKNNEVVFLSRQRKQFPFLSNIRSDIKKLLTCDGGKFANVTLDFEFYAHHLFGEKSGSSFKAPVTGGGTTLSNYEIDKDKNFDLISSMCRPGRSTPHPLEDQISAYIFDIVDETFTQDERFELLNLISETEVFRNSKVLVKGETLIVHSVDEVSLQHDLFAQRGYEGVIIRSRTAKYEADKRSLFIRKHKYFTDKEYKIIGIQKDEGVGDEHFTWVCENAKGKKFNVKPIGTQEAKRKIYKDPEVYFGKINFRVLINLSFSFL